MASTVMTNWGRLLLLQIGAGYYRLVQPSLQIRVKLLPIRATITNKGSYKNWCTT